MDHSTYIAAALAGVPTILVVLIGIVTSQRAFDRLDARMTGIEHCMGSIEARFARLECRVDRH